MLGNLIIGLLAKAALNEIDILTETAARPHLEQCPELNLLDFPTLLEP